MAEWQVEQGIGETRAMLVEGDTVLAARLHWPGSLAAGQVEDARLIRRLAGTPRGLARFASGEEALVDRLPADASEGALLRLNITRAAMAETGRLKRAQARPTVRPVCPAPLLEESLSAAGHPVRKVHRFACPGWDDLVGQAFAREVPFAGGSLILSPTPAMVLIDIDGALAPTALALAAIPAIATTLRQLDIAGSIGIDFPTLSAKTDRRQVDQALEDTLAGWPHEHTAMNGFGFVQIVARLERPSILHLVANYPASAAARLLLRRAEGVVEPGALLLGAHPQVRAAMLPEWEAQLVRRTGRQIRWHCDPALALEAGFAQAITA